MQNSERAIALFYPTLFFIAHLYHSPDIIAYRILSPRRRSFAEYLTVSGRSRVSAVVAVSTRDTPGWRCYSGSRPIALITQIY